MFRGFGGVCLGERGVVVEAAGPDFVPEAAAAGSSEVDDLTAAVFAPPHAGLFQALVEDDFAACFRDAAADRVAGFPASGVVHVRSVPIEITSGSFVVVRCSFELMSASDLSCTAENFSHAVGVMAKRVPLTFVPRLRFGCPDSVQAVGEQIQVFACVKEIDAPCPFERLTGARMFHRAKNILKVAARSAAGIGDVTQSQ